MVQEAANDFFEDSRFNCNRCKGAPVIVWAPLHSRRGCEMPRSRFGRREDPLTAEPLHWRKDLMVKLQYRQVKAASVLRHRQMNMVFMNLLPLQRICFRLSQPSKEDELVK